jgi:hypothetical protein
MENSLIIVDASQLLSNFYGSIVTTYTADYSDLDPLFDAAVDLINRDVQRNASVELRNMSDITMLAEHFSDVSLSIIPCTDPDDIAKVKQSCKALFIELYMAVVTTLKSQFGLTIPPVNFLQTRRNVILLRS